MQMRIETQTMDVLSYLKTHKRGITSKQAWEKFGITRLSAVIHRLRHIWKYEIDSIPTTVKNHRGKDVDVARYVLIGGEENE